MSKRTKMKGSCALWRRGGKGFIQNSSWGERGEGSRGNLEGLRRSRREGGVLDWARRDKTGGNGGGPRRRLRGWDEGTKPSLNILAYPRSPLDPLVPSALPVLRTWSDPEASMKP